jgi:diguanylate cyclase (GGDEF)-like protein/PAS domain S-box-containing protein
MQRSTTQTKALAVRESAADERAHDFNTDGALYECLIENLRGYAVFAVSPRGIILSWNRGARDMFGYSAGEAVGQPFDLIFTPEDVTAGGPANELASALGGTLVHRDRWHIRKDGTRFWGTNTVQPLLDGSGTLLGFAKLVCDTTDSHLALEALDDSEQRLRLLVESVDDFAIFSLALDGTVTSWNSGAERVFGYGREQMVGCGFAQVFSLEDVAADLPARQLRKAELHGSADIDSWLVRKDGTRFLASGKVNVLKRDIAGTSRGFVSIVHDRTAEHATAEELRRRAQFDELTELPNRRTFYEHVQRAIGSMKRRAANLFAVLFIDLDHFKDVNDEFGHLIADELLSATARRFEHCVRSEDIVARIGGDEFAILLNGINGVADASEAAERIAVLMRQPVSIGGRSVSATVSIGIAIGSPDYHKPEDVLLDADAAMYSAKLHGRARAVVFSAHLEPGVADNLSADLLHGLERNELRVAYQPIVLLRDATLAGFESLVRWEHPRRGSLLPAQFIPRAEESDLIVAIDRWMLTRACLQLAEWQTRGLDPRVQISVNVSSKEFARQDFLADLERLFESTKLAPACLRIEITESAIMEYSEKAVVLAAAIRKLGIALDVDDFGTGFSTLGMLHHLPIDALKLDSTFVAGLSSHTGTQIVETVLILAEKLGVAVIAEGIESAEQAQRLASLGCAFGQGLFFSPPLDAAAAARFASAASPRTSRKEKRAVLGESG